MSIGYTIAIHAVPFLELLDREVETVAKAVFGDGDEDGEGASQAAGGAAAGQASEGAEQRRADAREIASAMEASRRHLAQGIDGFVRRLPAAVRSDSSATRSAAYALVGLADERMLHYPSGELPGWRDHLLESELYGSALAGQEIIRQANESAREEAGGMMAPLYLALLREGFEGSLRGDVLGHSTLVSNLEDAVGTQRRISHDVAADAGPSRAGVPAGSLAIAGAALWLLSGIALWWALAGGDLADANRLAQRIEAGLSASFDPGDSPSITPSALPPESPDARPPD